MALIASYGGGVNSTAMLVWMVKNKLVVHHILFADTGGEKPETYSYVKMFSDWLVDNAYPEIITVKYATKNSNELTLEQDVLIQVINIMAEETYLYANDGCIHLIISSMIWDGVHLISIRLKE